MTTTLRPFDVVAWAVERWQSEVANRPLQNIHRRTLDSTWRQVVRQYGGDDEALLGPRHEDLLIAQRHFVGALSCVANVLGLTGFERHFCRIVQNKNRPVGGL